MIRADAEAGRKYIPQTGGSVNCRHANVRITSNEPVKGHEFTSDTNDSTVPKEYVKPVSQGCRATSGGQPDGEYQGVVA